MASRLSLAKPERASWGFTIPASISTVSPAIITRSVPNWVVARVTRQPRVTATAIQALMGIRPHPDGAGKRRFLKPRQIIIGISANRNPDVRLRLSARESYVRVG